MLSVESLSLWQNHLSIHWSLCCLSKSQSCLGELSIQGVFYLSNFLRFLSSKLVMFHLSHSEKFWAPWQEAKQKLYHIDNYYPRNVPGALYSFQALKYSMFPRPNNVSVLCTPTKRDDSGFLLRSALIDDPFILSISAICHCQSVTIQSMWPGEGQNEN